MSSKFCVFVYGTLKKGQPNHNWFEKNPNGMYEFICSAETVEKHPLIVATKYNVPFLLYAPGTGYNVKGEVYEVDENVLNNLDILEDHPTLYTREEHSVKRLDNNQVVKVWIYFIKHFKKELLDLSLLENYDNQDNSYVSREKRDHDKLSDLLQR